MIFQKEFSTPSGHAQGSASCAITAFLGLALGVGTGAILLKGNFNASHGSWKIKVLRVFVGSAFIILMMLFLKKIFPTVNQPLYLFFRIVRYFTIGFLSSYLLPRFFIKINWAKPIL